MLSYIQAGYGQPAGAGRRVVAAPALPGVMSGPAVQQHAGAGPQRGGCAIPPPPGLYTAQSDGSNSQAFHALANTSLCGPAYDPFRALADAVGPAAPALFGPGGRYPDGAVSQEQLAAFEGSPVYAAMVTTAGGVPVAVPLQQSTQPPPPPSRFDAAPVAPHHQPLPLTTSTINEASVAAPQMGLAASSSASDAAPAAVPQRKSRWGVAPSQ